MADTTLLELCMPYKIETCGIYRITNTVTGRSYVGQSRKIKKRIKEHFRLLRHGTHPNANLQAEYIQYGVEAFMGVAEIECDDPADLDSFEEAFLQGRAFFTDGGLYNISTTAHIPMFGRVHSTEVRVRISAGRRGTTFDYGAPEHRKKLAERQMARYFADPKFVAKVKYIIENTDLSYAERARRVGTDTSSARKLAINYQHLKGVL